MDRSAHIFLDLREIKRQLKIQVEDDEEIDALLENKKRLKNKAIVPSIFDFILWVIVIFTLVTTVL